MKKLAILMSINSILFTITIIYTMITGNIPIIIFVFICTIINLTTINIWEYIINEYFISKRKDL